MISPTTPSEESKSAARHKRLSLEKQQQYKVRLIACQPFEDISGEFINKLSSTTQHYKRRKSTIIDSLGDEANDDEFSIVNKENQIPRCTSVKKGYITNNGAKLLVPPKIAAFRSASNTQKFKVNQNDNSPMKKIISSFVKNSP